MSSIFMMILLGVIVAAIAGIIVLQIFLSKNNNSWLGLVLPFICLCFSVIVTLVCVPSSTVTTGYQEMIVEDEDGIEVVERKEIKQEGENTFLEGAVIVVITFVFYNIPTAILLLIYFTVREKGKSDKALEKMKLQDL